MIADDEIGFLAFKAFRPADTLVWPHVGDKDRWIRVGRNLFEKGYAHGIKDMHDKYEWEKEERAKRNKI